MISRRRVVLALGATALTVPFSTFSQQPRTIPLVGVLHPGSPPPAPLPLAIVGIKQGLRDLGYVEGQTIAIEYRYAGGKPESMPGIALELAKLKVDVLVAIGLPSIKAANAAAGVIPILATDLEIDPVASGFAVSYAKPGRNITGLFFDFPGVMGKWLQLLSEAVPGIRSAAVLWDTGTGQFQLDALTVAAKKLSIALDVVKFQQAVEIEALLIEALKKRPQVLLQLSSPIIHQQAARIAKITQANRLPAISMFRAFAEAGGLMSYGPDQLVFFRRIASLIDKILKGVKPGEIPLERPTQFDLVVNMKTAKALGIKFPQSILVQATKIIE